MNGKLLDYGARVISGENRSVVGRLLGGAAAVGEPVYSFLTWVRNGLFDRGLLASRNLGRPVVSVGNITTGGTGKTPVVLWLAEALRAAGHRPAILLRGYGETSEDQSDEAVLLDRALNRPGEPVVPVRANPSRSASAAAVLGEFPGTGMFILDDGFQHRRARRNFDLVLVSATCPFGYGHVLPRGLLREPMSGLKRAHAFVITRQSLVPADTVAKIESELRSIHPGAPVFRADHITDFVRFKTGTIPLTALDGKAVVIMTGIADPRALTAQIEAAGCRVVDRQFYPDHHRYTAADVQYVQQRATAAGAECVLTTEKDWVKLGPLIPDPRAAKIGVIEVRIAVDRSADLISSIERAI